MEALEIVKSAILQSLEDLSGMIGEELKRQRYEKFRAMGQMLRSGAFTRFPLPGRILAATCARLEFRR